MTTDALVAGGMDALTASDGSVFETAAALSSGVFPFDTAFADCAVRVGTGTGNITSYAEANHANLTTYWKRFDLYFLANGAPSLEYPLMRFYNSVGTEVAKITVTSASLSDLSRLVRTYIWNGSAFVQVGAGFYYQPDTRTPFVVNFVPTTGAFAIYLSGSLRDSGTGSTFSNICKSRMYAAYMTTYWSQIRVADYSLIGTNLKTIVPDTASATNTAWTGTYIEVDEVAYSDADFIYSTSNGDVETYTKSGLDLSAYIVQGMAVSARANCGATGPQNLQLALRTSATNYVSASILQGAGYAVSQNIWATNPNTSAAWASAAAQAAEFGVKAIT